MLQKISHLHKAALITADDRIGKVVDLLFERANWTVRYLVAATGPWLLGRKVLISTVAVSRIDWEHREIETNLTLEQIKESPEIDPQRTIVRPQEIELFTHYGWPSYWPAGGFTAVPPSDPFQFAQQPPESTDEQLAESAESLQETRFQSVSEALGCKLQALDGKAGHLADFLVDPDSWRIRQLLFETGGKAAGKEKQLRVLAVERLKEPNWEAHRLRVDLSRERIQQGPPYDPPTS